MPIPPAPAPATTALSFSGPLKEAALDPLPSFASLHEGDVGELQPARFLLGVSDRGEVRYVFLLDPSGDKALDTGANGASRALVLADGIPLNDPFGGWVFWDQVPEQEIGCIEVVEGGMSDLYGSTALGGVVQIETKPPLDTNLSLESSLGNELTAFSSAHATLRSDLWAISINGEGFRTDGYIPAPASLRGSPDSSLSWARTLRDWKNKSPAASSA